MRLFLAVPPEEIGQRLLYCTSNERFPAAGPISKGSKNAIQATDGTHGGGAYAIRYTGEDSNVQQYYEQLRKGGLMEKVVQHTAKAFQTIAGGDKFLD